MLALKDILRTVLGKEVLEFITKGIKTLSVTEAIILLIVTTLLLVTITIILFNLLNKIFKKAESSTIEKEEKVDLEEEKEFPSIEKEVEQPLFQTFVKEPEESNPSDPIEESIAFKIEQAAMTVVIRYEETAGREVKDVSNTYAGYDLFESCNYKSNVKDIRFIEVKGKTTQGDIIITRHEWDVAEQQGALYWLYIVNNADSEFPELTVIQNPYKNISVKPNQIQYKFLRSEYVYSSEAYKLVFK